MAIFKPHIRAMGAYKPPLEGRDPKLHLLLDFNERTLPPGEEVLAALLDYIHAGRIQTYPAYAGILRQLADYTGVSEAQLMITNGSDQGIDLAFRAACQPGDEVIIPGPSFAMYNQCAGIENAKIIAPHYSIDGGYPLSQVITALNRKTRLIVVANPNNPSGTLVPREAIVQLAEAAPEACILVDECYFEYSQATVVDLVGQYPNLVVTRTFSKTWGLPSLRFGYVVSAADNILTLLNIRGPYDINQLAVVAAAAALRNQSNVKAYINEVMGESKPMFEAFLVSNDIPFWPSAANFLWIFPENPDTLATFLRDKNILVRPKSDGSGKVGLRVTLGTKEQVKHLIRTMEQAFAAVQVN